MGYPKERKEAVLKKMLPPHNRSIPSLAAEEGISSATLYNWRKAARSAGRLLPDGETTPEGWGSADKFAAVLEAAALNAQRAAQGLDEVDTFTFMKLIRELIAEMKMDDAFLHRGVNAGFSGGEKKRNEILQMRLLQPKLALLDETDSGLDIDALKVVSDGINHLRGAERGIVLVTHYQRLLNYVEPDFVHILYNGRIIKSGDKSLAQRLEAEGYQEILEEAS